MAKVRIKQRFCQSSLKSRHVAEGGMEGNTPGMKNGHDFALHRIVCLEIKTRLLKEDIKVIDLGLSNCPGKAELGFNYFFFLYYVLSLLFTFQLL